MARPRTGSKSWDQRRQHWRLVISLGSDVNGKRLRIVETFRPRPDKGFDPLGAQMALAALIKRGETIESRPRPVASVVRVKYPELSVGDIVGRYIDASRRRLGPKTADGYDDVLRLYLPSVGTIAGHRLTRQDVRDLWDRLDAEANALARKRARRYSPERVRKAHKLLNAALNWAVSEDLIERNPVAGMKGLPGPTRKTHQEPLSAEEVAKILLLADEVGPPGLSVYWALAANLGARRGELCELRWGAVDIERGEVTLESALTKVRSAKGQQWVQVPTKGKVAHTEQVGTTMTERLRVWRERSEQRAAEHGHPLHRRSYVFSKDGAGAGHWLPDYPHVWWGRIVAQLGWTDEFADRRIRGAHDLRHHMATEMAYDPDVSFSDIARRMGCTRANVETNYGHLRKSTNARVASITDY